MTHERDVERLLDRWFSEGPREAPDRVLETVTDRIHHRRQRPAWLLERRPPTMAGPIRLLAAAAVLVGALAVGSVFLAGGAQRVAVATPAPSLAVAAATPTPPPTLAPTPSPSGPRTFYSYPVMAAGDYVADVHIGKLSLTLPDGWSSPGQAETYILLRPTAGPLTDIVNVYTDMRRPMKDAACTEAPDPGVKPGAAALIADLAADDQLVVTKPVPVELPGLTGSYIDVRTSPKATRVCPFFDGKVTVPLVVDEIPREGPFWGIAPGGIDRIYAFDTADGHNVVILVESANGETFDALAAATKQVVDSMSFTPNP